MGKKEYIDRGAIKYEQWACVGMNAPLMVVRKKTIDEIPVADVVEVVRCKDCIWFVPEFVLTNDGERRPYTGEEKNLPFGVLANVGINCGSRCERCSEWEENRVPVFVQENDFCSYGERKVEKQ